MMQALRHKDLCQFEMCNLNVQELSLYVIST